MRTRHLTPAQRRAIWAKEKHAVRTHRYANKTSVLADATRKAKHPGKRKTTWGTTYTEKRVNRADSKGTRNTPHWL